MLAAAKPVPAERLVMVQSTGRCGSTLVSHAFATADNVMSFAEPDVYYQLHHFRDHDDAEFEPLLKTCTTLLCAPRPVGTWVIKFRSLHIELAGPLLGALPGANDGFPLPPSRELGWLICAGLPGSHSGGAYQLGWWG